MKTFIKESNGFKLMIEVDEDKLLYQLDEDIKEMVQLKKSIAEDSPEDPDDADYDYRWEYDMGRVYGDYESDWCTPDEIIKNREDFKTVVSRLVSGNGDELWNMIQLKKNGTFKKNSKPMIKEAVNGTYWEDSYGWNTLVMRLVPVSDTLAQVKLEHIVLHY